MHSSRSALSVLLFPALAWVALALSAALGCAASVSSGQAANADEEQEQFADDCGESSACMQLCEQQDAGACEWLGRMHETGEGAPQDYQRAADMYDRACNLGRADSCAHLAMMYDIGLAVEENENRAEQLYHQACEGGNRWACRRAEQLSP